MRTQVLDQQRRSYEQIYEMTGLGDEARGYRRILRLLRPLPAWRILDVACGEGHLLAEACALTREAWGLDLSASALARPPRAPQPLDWCRRMLRAALFLGVL